MRVLVLVAALLVPALAKLDLCAYLQLLGGHSPDCQAIPLLRRTGTIRLLLQILGSVTQSIETTAWVDILASGCSNKEIELAV